MEWDELLEHFVVVPNVENTIYASPERTKSAMNNFLYTVVSYLPLHEKTVETANEVGIVEVKSICSRIGFKHQ
ncbi:hypothetical protein J22TS1_37450 [Siminovitchia terrae]|nr:hypothetical protein J22TS1_37450 [Siminovitchia terrae]